MEEQKQILLQPSEWVLMEKLWEQSPKTVMQLYHELKEAPGWSKSTVSTMLARMEKKKLLAYKEGEKARQYYPLISQEEAALNETESMLKRVYHGSISMMMSTLVRNEKLTKRDLEELYQMLEEEK